MGTLPKMVQQHMERFWQKQRKLDELTQPGWEDPDDYCCGRDMKYGMTAFRIMAVVKLQMDGNAAARSPTTFGDSMEHLDSIPGISIFCKGLRDRKVGILD
jgi:hypothetical protein